MDNSPQNIYPKTIPTKGNGINQLCVEELDKIKFINIQKGHCIQNDTN